MFDLDFYPTPSDVVRRMIEPYSDKIRKGKMSVLEPSCGKGDIIKRLIINNTGYTKHNQFYAFEKDANLKIIASDIEHLNILGSDFLEYGGGHYFNLIIMNPPFSEGVKHLLHAWNILHEGDICCLLNEETVKNPFSQERKLLLNIIKEHGTVEYLGSCFSSAERKTNVGVAMVRLKKIAAENIFSFEKIGLDANGNRMQFDFQNENANSIATRDVIGNKVLCFSELQKAMQEVIKAMLKAEFYGKAIGFNIYRTLGEFCKYGHSYTNSSEEASPQLIFNDFTKQANEAAWKSVLNETNFKSKITSDFQKNFDKFAATQGGAAFTKHNIIELLSYIYENGSQIIHQCIVSVFDRLTAYSPKNKDLSWKTNSHYKLNRKIIMPDCGRWDNRWGFSLHGYGSRFNEWSRDLDLACCHLTGKKIEDIGVNYSTKREGTTINATVEQHCKKHNFNTEPTQSEFFKIRIYKKGTIHLEFLDEDLWNRFNIEATKDRNWLSDENK